jgi:hypothetical protein
MCQGPSFARHPDDADALSSIAGSLTYPFKNPIAAPMRKVKEEYGRYPATCRTLLVNALPLLNTDMTGVITWFGATIPNAIRIMTMIAIAAPIISAFFITMPTRNPRISGTKIEMRKVIESAGGNNCLTAFVNPTDT